MATIYMAKEAYLWQKRPIYMAKEAYLYGKRGATLGR